MAWTWVSTARDLMLFVLKKKKKKKKKICEGNCIFTCLANRGIIDNLRDHVHYI
jgi:hypothetical protein